MRSVSIAAHCRIASQQPSATPILSLDTVRWTQSTDTNHVVGQAGKAHQLAVAPNAAQPGLAKTPYRLAPTKELLNAFAHDLAGSVCRREQNLSIRAGRVVGRIDGHVRAICRASKASTNRLL